MNMSAYLTRAQVRELDERATKEFGVPSIVLMENAGRNCADLMMSFGMLRLVVVCCGKGNNGGDGFVIARHLDRMDVPVTVILLAAADSLQGDARTNVEIVQKTGLRIMEVSLPQNRNAVETTLQQADWIVDALFGIGLNSAPMSPFTEVIEMINRSSAQVLAVDVPSGLDCDSGAPLGPTVEANITATFVAKKKGFANPTAKKWLGMVHVLDIGAPRQLVNQYLSQAPS
jgi:NAD(P)H-hydrate epimerase